LPLQCAAGRHCLDRIPPDTVREKAQAVQNDQYGPAFMSDYRQRQRQIEEQSARDEHQHSSNRDGEVLPDDSGGAPRQPVRLRQLLHVFRQQGHIGRLEPRERERP
jgi:hypothetical protein